MDSATTEPTTQQENFLFLFRYSCAGETGPDATIWTCFDYFKDFKEARAFFTNTAAPHILPISLQECTQGLHLRSKSMPFMPYKESEYLTLVKKYYSLQSLH